MKRVILLCVCLFLFHSSAAAAQTGALVSAQVQFLQNGAILPSQTMTITAANWTCGQVKPTVPSTVYINAAPARVFWDDPSNSALACIATQTGGVLFALPLGNNYTATATFTDDFGGVSLASPPSNSFTRGVRPLPAAPTGVRITQ